MRNLRPLAPINAGSMADIAFLLLIFFLVATTIEPDKGIQVLLPEYSENERHVTVNEKRVLAIKINAHNELMIEDKRVEMSEVTNSVKNHVITEIERGSQPIISILTDTAAVYDIYLSVYNNIKKGYNDLRQEESHIQFKKDYNQLDKMEKRVIIQRIPMVISEADYL